MFFPKVLKHVEGALAGRPFVLEPWQRSIIANLFGWKRIDTQGRTVRRYREVLIYVPRKSGKSPMAAGILFQALVEVSFLRSKASLLTNFAWPFA